MLKIWLSSLFILCASIQSNAEPIQGIITINHGQYSITLISNGKTFSLKPVSITVTDQLNKLKNRDLLTGNGTISGNQLLLDNVDFVGLSQLIGLWSSTSNNSLLAFHDYSHVTVYASISDTKASKLLYSVAPGIDSGWKVFFTDSNAVQLAALSLRDNRAELQFYDAQSGDIKDTIELQRVSPR